ncbi:hypothetical protein [Subtercola sp. YIM 133946]|uniref:hypothetical protein n=1 Tax=Subtercola sp. YIM 133946 TaxID=3118909 RepID=UPI002F95F8AA
MERAARRGLDDRHDRHHPVGIPADRRCLMVDFVDGNRLAEMVRANKRQDNAAPVGYTSVSDGSLRILSPEGFYVGGEASAVVHGLLEVLGTLNLSGSFLLTGNTTASGAWAQSGSLTLTGPFTVEGNTSMTGNFTSTGEFTLTGPFHVNGPTDVNGTLTINGVSTFIGDESHTGNISLTGNLSVDTGGSITAGVVKIDNGGSYGGRIYSPATLELDALEVIVSELTSNDHIYASANIESDTDVIAYGSLKSPNIGTTTTTSNVVVDSSGKLLRSTSARRFKRHVHLTKLSPELLAVRFRDWQDRFDLEGPRVPGVIAEEVAAAEGGELFIGRDAKGKVESVAYDRLALARTQILAEQLEQARAEIAELRELINSKL